MRILALTCVPSLLGAGVASAGEPSSFVFDAEAHAFPITATSGEWTTPQTELMVSRRVWDDNALHVYVGNSQANTYYVVDLSRHDENSITPRDAA